MRKFSLNWSIFNLFVQKGNILDRVSDPSNFDFQLREQIFDQRSLGRSVGHEFGQIYGAVGQRGVRYYRGVVPGSNLGSIAQWREWGSIRCKHIVRRQQLSQRKARLLWLVENAFSPIAVQQLTSGTSAATHKLMEPHCDLPLVGPGSNLVDTA